MVLPKGGKKVGVKWIYKTKFNEMGKSTNTRLGL